jgi:hypothetical protein
MKIRLVGAELFHAERRTDGQMERDMAKLILAFRSISNAPDKEAQKCRSMHAVI